MTGELLRLAHAATGKGSDKAELSRDWLDLF